MSKTPDKTKKAVPVPTAAKPTAAAYPTSASAVAAAKKAAAEANAAALAAGKAPPVAPRPASASVVVHVATPGTAAATTTEAAKSTTTTSTANTTAASSTTTAPAITTTPPVVAPKPTTTTPATTSATTTAPKTATPGPTTTTTTATPPAVAPKPLVATTTPATTPATTATAAPVVAAKTEPASAVTASTTPVVVPATTAPATAPRPVTAPTPIAATEKKDPIIAPAKAPTPSPAPTPAVVAPTAIAPVVTPAPAPVKKVEPVKTTPAPVVKEKEHARKLSAYVTKPLPNIPPLTPEQAVLQYIPKDAAMLELLPRGDVFSAHKVATTVTEGVDPTEFPVNIQEKLALFEQSFSVLRFPHKTYNAVAFDPPQFKETFHTDTIVAPTTNAPVGALMRSSKTMDLMPDDAPSKMRITTVSDVFESLGVEESISRSRSTLDPDAFNAPKQISGSEESGKGSSSEPAVTSSSESSAVVLRSYFPNYDWSNGAEVALCERQPLPPPTRATGPAIRFLLHAKALQLAITQPAHGHEIEPLFCELAIYNTTPEARAKLTDNFSVQLSNHQVVKMLETQRMSNARLVAANTSKKEVVSPFVPESYVNSTSQSACTRALFSLPSYGQSTHNKSGIAVVLLVYKVLQGKLESSLDLYAKGADIREKDIKNLESKASDAAKRWGEHRQLMMWSAAPLFNEAGALATLEFNELYRPPKIEEAFTLQTLTDAAATLLGKKKNPAGYKVIPGQFICNVTPLPSSRPAAIAEAEKVAPVYNTNMVPVAMESVVESVEAICVGHEMLANNVNSNNIDLSKLASPEPASPAGPNTTGGASVLVTPPSRTAKAGSVFSPVPESERAGSALPDQTLLSPSSVTSSTTQSEQTAMVAADEWVEVNTTGSLVHRKSGQLTVSLSSPETAAPKTPLSPNSRAMIKLDHTRPRSYVLPPDGEKMSSVGYILEVEPVGELALHDVSIPPPRPATAGAQPSTPTGSVNSHSTLTVPSVASSSSSSSSASAAAAAAAAAAIAADESASSPFHLHYTNHLYVYPEKIEFNDARNVVVGVQIKDTHESANEPGLDLIYPRADELLNGVTVQGTLRTSKTPGTFINQTFTSATYHCYNTAFLDEIKIELPLILKPTHHLLFTFYNISCKDTIVPSKDGSGDDRTLLGYSMLPLYLDNRIVDEGYTLPVCSKLRPHYLLQKDEWENRRQSLFQVRLRLNSTLYTNDPFLNRFFLKCSLPYLTPAPVKDTTETDSTKTTKKDITGSDEMLSMMLRKVLRAGQLKKKGGLKWTERWWALNESTVIVYKSHKESKIWHHTPISSKTTTLRNAGTQKADDELRFAWTIRAGDETFAASVNANSNALPEPSTPLTVREDSTSTKELTEKEDPPSTAASPTSVSSPPATTTAPATTGATATPATPATPSASASPSATTATSPPLKPVASVSSSPPPIKPITSPSQSVTSASASPPATGSVPSIPGLDAESFEVEMQMLAENEDEMFSWLKAIAHAKIAKWNVLESVRGVKEAQGELLVKHLPMIMRQLLGVICCPESIVDVNALDSTGVASSPKESGSQNLERMKQTAFETMLEVASLVETGTPAVTGDKQRNVHLDSWCQYIFDDNSSALPLHQYAAAAAAGEHARNGSVSVSQALASAATESPASASAPGAASPTSPAPKIQRIRSYESLATFWLMLLKGQTSTSTATASPSTGTSGFSLGSVGSNRSLPPLREYAARFSWMLLDMISKSLLLSTAGHRERRVSMSFGQGGGSVSSIFGTLHRPSMSVATGGSNVSGSNINFFKPATLKLLTDLVSGLTQEIYALSSISLTLSKTLNKNLALFLRDAFYIFPKTVVFDWISLYLMISYKLESSRSSAGGLGSSISSGGSSGSSSRFKYTALQIICDHEHFVNYNIRIAPFVGEAKKYLQSSEFGEWASMGDYMNQPWKPEEKEPEPTQPQSSPGHSRKRSQSTNQSMDDSSLHSRSSSELNDQLHPMRSEMNRSVSPSSSKNSYMTAPAGHFLPYVLIKQVWLAFRQFPPAPAGAASSISIAQEQALTQSAYTLRTVLLKHELDARYQGPRKRSTVAAMYLRILPCLWNNLDKLKEMKTAPVGSVAATGVKDDKNSVGGTGNSVGCSNARKDLIACALYVLNNISAPELLKYLKDSDYKIHTANIRPWFFQFIELLSLILETVEYAGPLMRRLESLTGAGGVVSQLTTTLCARQMIPNVLSATGDPTPISDWGGAEEIGGGRLGAAGGLSALENKYQRGRVNTQLQGHRKSVVATGGTIKRREVQMGSNLQAAERARTRLANRTLNSKTGALLEGGDAQFHAITGIDPAIQRWEKLYAHESSSIVLHILTQVVLPITQADLIQARDMQDRFLWFLHSFLTLNQSDQMLISWFSLLSKLLDQYAYLIWPLELKPLDRQRCSGWWFQLLRHLSFHNPDTRAAASNFIYQIFLSVSNATGSTNRIQGPLMKAFAKVMDSLRNRKSEDGTSTYHDPLISSVFTTSGWTILQSDPKLKESVNDATYIGVLSALAKSASALATRAKNDPKRADFGVVACIQDIGTNFTLLTKIIDTSAIIHSVKASSLDTDILIEHCHSMVQLYRRAPRMKLLYLKHMYDLHMSQQNLAEAGAIQLWMFKTIHRQSIRINAEGRVPLLSLWNSDHATSCLKKASELFEAAELYEQASHCENYSISHWVARKNPSAVVPHAKRLVHLWEKLASLSTLGDTRSFGTFYRVGFYGAPFAALGMDGKEFVYREPNLTKLPEITSRLVSLWSTILHQEVTVFKDSGVIDRAALGNDVAKLQVTAVLPFFEEDAAMGPPPPPNQSLVHPPTVFELTAEHLTSRETHFEKNTALRKFFYDTPYTQSGKSHGTVETQFKKRSLISLSPTDSFPSILRRLPVATRTEIDMTPLQCVLEDIHKRIHKLVSEARPALGNPDLKTLTQVLSGSVNVQVNGGTAEVCQVFLSPENRSKWNEKEIEILKLALAAFVKASGEALQVAIRLANETSENKAFIEVLTAGYQTLVTAVKLAVPDLAI